MVNISVILTIFNKEKIIKNVITSLLENTSELTNEYIFILDGCSDNSEKILRENLCKIPHNAKYKIFYTPNVFELKANNKGLKNVSNFYAIIIQDDMQIMEKDWDKRLIEPMIKYNDIWAVTARTAVNLKINGKWYDNCEGPVGHNYNTKNDYPRNKIFLRQIVNRGPLALKMDVVKLLGYFDETLPGVIGCDDADLCLKAFNLYKLRTCSYFIYYYSPLEWGATRVGPNVSYVSKEETKNRNEIIKRYKEILINWNFNEEREI